MAFRCPRCRSGFFSTHSTDSDDIADWIGYCKGWPNEYGRGYTGCTFTWSRADDAKYGEGDK